MRAFIILVLIVTVLPLAPPEAGAVPVRNLFGLVESDGEQWNLASGPTIRYGRYGFEPLFTLGSFHIEDPVYDGRSSISWAGGVISAVGVALALPVAFGQPYRDGGSSKYVRYVVWPYLILTSVLNSQHQLVLLERARDARRLGHEGSVFVGTRTEIWQGLGKNEGPMWGQYGIVGGLRYGFWLRDEDPVATGLAVQVSVEHPWYIVGGEWRDSHARGFVGLLYWWR